MEVGHAFNSVLVLVREVSLHYYSRINSISSSDIIVDFNSVFGRHMESSRRSKIHITDAMWESTLGDDFSIDIRVIRKWLEPRDRVLKAVLDDRLVARGHQDEYTCEWFHRYLANFAGGKDDVLAVTGPDGCGKSVIADWVVGRVQRPLGRKSYQSLSYTLGKSLRISSFSFTLDNGGSALSCYCLWVTSFSIPKTAETAISATLPDLLICFRSVLLVHTT